MKEEENYYYSGGDDSEGETSIDEMYEKITSACGDYDTETLENLFEDTLPIERETSYCLEVVRISEEKRKSDEKELADGLLMAIAGHIRFTTVSEVILDAIERGAPKETILFFLEIYPDPVELWGMFNDHNDDAELIKSFWVYFAEAFPSLTPSELKRLWEELHFQAAEIEILLVFIDLVFEYLSKSEHLLESGFNDEVEALKIFLNNEKEILQKTEYELYPVDGFKGDLALRDIRKDIIKRHQLPWENKIAASLIGYPLSTNYRSFPEGSPYHPMDIDRGERYFRGSRHPLYSKLFSEKKSDSISDENEASGVKGGLGNAPAPTSFAAEVRKYSPLETQEWGDIYNFLLAHKRRSCSTIRDQCGNLEEIKVGYYNDYPCVMVHITHFATNLTDAQKAGWTEIVISFFVGLINYEAQKAKLPIELVRRSSFGFLTPTIAPCAESFRINPGLIPKDYIELLVKCLGILNNVLRTFNNKEKGIDISLPATGFLSGDSKAEYEKYKGGSLVATNIVALANESITKEAKITRTGASFLASSFLARAQLALAVHNFLLDHPETKDGEDPSIRYTNALCHALRWGLERTHVVSNGKGLSFRGKVNELQLKNSRIDGEGVKDEQFFNEIHEKFTLIYKRLSGIKGSLVDAGLKTVETIFECRDNRDIRKLLGNFEKLNELLFAESISKHVAGEDGHGSDSEISDEESETRIYGKKVIVDHGMMSIQQSIDAAAERTNSIKTKGKGIVNIFFNGPYYETPKVYKNIEKKLQRLGLTMSKTRKESKADVIFYDLNSCVTDGKPLTTLTYKSGIAWIIDVTSASIEAQQACITHFKKCKKVQLLFLISSGLKNEQMGADKIPYGTIRYFTKDKAHLAELDKKLRAHGPEKSSGLPHIYRRMMKSLGCVPTNNRIIHSDALSIAMPKAQPPKVPSAPTAPSPKSGGAKSGKCSSRLFGVKKGAKETSETKGTKNRFSLLSFTGGRRKK